MKKTVRSQEIYLLDINDVSALSRSEEYIENSEDIVILLGNSKELRADTLLSGGERLADLKKQGETYAPVYVAHYSCASFLAFFIHSAKLIKRRFLVFGTNAYGAKLDDLLNKNLLRGIRTRENAYQWNNKRWKIPPEERERRYQDLYDSMKQSGYDKKQPLIVCINRRLGVADQLLQGHHRIGICREMEINDVCVTFSYYPKSFVFMKFFIPKKKKISE